MVVEVWGAGLGTYISGHVPIWSPVVGSWFLFSDHIDGQQFVREETAVPRTSKVALDLAFSHLPSMYAFWRNKSGSCSLLEI